MPRYRVVVEYDGTPFVGWQRQENGPSVQAALEHAVKKLSGEEVSVFGAGRTDAGVHARGQVAHFDLSSQWDLKKIRDGLTYHLRPNPIVVLKSEAVDVEFDARFDAVKRYYVYRIINRHSPLTLEVERAWQINKPLDHEVMHKAGQFLIGKHDFTAFRSAHCQAKSALRTLDAVTVIRTGEVIEISVNARSFLHNQVRSIVGSLKMVGEGKWSPDYIIKVLESRDRSGCGPVAPACGLYLVRVEYGHDRL